MTQTEWNKLSRATAVAANLLGAVVGIAFIYGGVQLNLGFGDAAKCLWQGQIDWARPCPFGIALPALGFLVIILIIVANVAQYMAKK